MFTGIVTDMGDLVKVERKGEVKTLTVATDFDAAGIDIGASIAHAGVCLTVTSVTPGGPRATLFTVDAAPETLAITTVAGWDEGRRINLERSLKIGDELGGHMVSGHVDCTAKVVSREDLGTTTRFVFEVPEKLARFVAAKGSVALDGTSLTVNEVNGNTFSCLLIPHTLAVTTWGGVKAGDTVNFEADLMARYAARLAEFPRAS
ncbi:riboflavin synthase [Xanthobacter autotrophicus]|uniref:riboflavin synthase n=1 Tax=Xanthobacter autotrophicus TaxID=280 RepID=UPI001E5C76CE|nr:riboflavin synthase [Xanthobacter autotrophicus]UDQ88929.1 riboflavin synthase [Xanthobacter autotrophicus]